MYIGSAKDSTSKPTKTIWTRDNVKILGIHHGFRELFQLYFMNKNGQRRYKYLVQGRDKFYFVRQQSDSTKAFSETDFISMLEFLIDNIFIMFDERVFFYQQSAYQWIHTVHFSPTCSFIRMRQTS